MAKYVDIESIHELDNEFGIEDFTLTAKDGRRWVYVETNLTSVVEAAEETAACIKIEWSGGELNRIGDDEWEWESK